MMKFDERECAFCRTPLGREMSIGMNTPCGAPYWVHMGCAQTRSSITKLVDTLTHGHPNSVSIRLVPVEGEGDELGYTEVGLADAMFNIMMGHGADLIEAVDALNAGNEMQMDGRMHLVLWPCYIDGCEGWSDGEHHDLAHYRPYCPDCAGSEETHPEVGEHCCDACAAKHTETLEVETNG